ncbi:MAG: DUF2797 domain-containing protein [Gammaproteobacteria bacterium]|nr:DUF2797 domain-containing protein [Gammaproteobacteria bacterium]
MLVIGNLRKMPVLLATPVNYCLLLGENSIELNPLLGKKLVLRFSGEINCIHCGRKTSKSFQQGYCFPCMRSLAECDSCIVKPETCHFDQGTCREPEWAKAHCFQPHIVYLANSSGVKVGITRQNQVPTRWIDQGATQALPVFKVQNRFQSGLMEVVLKQHVADRTDWRKMLRGENETLDLLAIRDDLLQRCKPEIDPLIDRFGGAAIELLSDVKITAINYPVLQYPEKVKSLDFDKTENISGILQGIKGQYLILDSGVINIRKFGGYKVEFEY